MSHPRKHFEDNIRAALELMTPPSLSINSTFEQQLKQKLLSTISTVSYRFSFDEEKENAVYYFGIDCHRDPMYRDFFDVADLLAESCESSTSD